MTSTTPPTSASAGATDAKGVTGRLADWLHRLDDEAIPGPTRTRAAYLLLDGVACALVGARLPWSDVAVEAITAMEGAGDSTLIGRGRTLPGPAACLLNGTFIQGFELDDYHPAAPLHSMSLVLPSALATIENLDQSVSGSDLLTALIAGFEVGPRVGRALRGGEMLSRGWHSGAVFGTFAAAATAGRLRGLTPARFEDALGLAATQSGGLMAAQYEAMSKRMHHGFAARAGFTAAGLAAAGYTGIKRVFERDYGGFLATFGEGHDPLPGEVVGDLGNRWETDAIAVKAYAAMAATHAPIDCTLQLREAGLTAEHVDQIDLWVSHAAYHHGWWKVDGTLETIGAQMNIGYAVAVALLDGEVLPQQFTRQRITAADVWSVLSRVRVHHETAYDEPDARFRCRVAVRTLDGQELTADVDGPRGGVGRPLSNTEVESKARSLLTAVLPPDDVDQLVQLTLGVDALPSIAPLVELMAREVRAPDVML
jgi:aconitate decarboxylase